MDYKANPHTSIIDSELTTVMDGNFVKVVTWYDNEWGYSCRTSDLAALMAKSL
jgi:glyceraldehyde 3-phosphate dehydrogenase